MSDKLKSFGYSVLTLTKFMKFHLPSQGRVNYCFEWSLQRTGHLK